MIDALVFSRDRGCQLDLLLTSLEARAGVMQGRHGRVRVLWKAQDDEFERGYVRCKLDHPKAEFIRESQFSRQVRDIVKDSGDFVMFLTDDSVFYRPFDENVEPYPTGLLRWDASVICVSLRLGQNTGNCYPLNRLQGLPAFERQDDALVWRWRNGDADFGYPGSVDAHVFRRDYLRSLMNGMWSNPNTLEEVLMRNCQGDIYSQHMACYERSYVVSLPLNRTNESHGNRYGESHSAPARELNDRYLLGGKLSLQTVPPMLVTGAHQEFRPVWQ